MNLTEHIESVILSNLHSADERKIGVECECFFYDKKQRRIPANLGDSFSSTDLLNELINLQSDDEIKAGYSLEPGGQLEWSSPPMKTLHEINAQFWQHKVRISEIVKREKLKIIDYSLEPLYAPQDIELIDNEKYRLMDQMFTQAGELGQWMMRNTSSIQINIDFSSREEAERMAYISDCISPIASILFANSPFWKGGPCGNQNLRYKIWSNTDNSRCGNLLDHAIENAEHLVKKYAKYVQTVPAIFVKDEKGKVTTYKSTLGSWLNELFNQSKLSSENIQLALHQIFTHVRFKNVLEIRSSDRPLAGFELAPVAFWIGLLFDDKTQNEIFNTVKAWTAEERKKLIISANNLDLEQIGPNGKSIGEWIINICDLSLMGLNKRSNKNGIENEASFLKDYLYIFNKKGIVALYTQKELEKNNRTVREFI